VAEAKQASTCPGFYESVDLVATTPVTQRAGRYDLTKHMSNNTRSPILFLLHVRESQFVAVSPANDDNLQSGLHQAANDHKPKVCRIIVEYI
jgi:hypothetical protein